MKAKVFAAIDVGSYELAMKIFEVSSKGMKQIDEIRYQLDLGSDTYATGKIPNEKVDELCRILGEYKGIMDSYKADDYKAYATSAIRETENTLVLLDRIKQRTGIVVEVLSNSEQRFLDYKSIASKTEGFNKIIEKGTAIVDIGGGSVQISLFDKDSLVSTQNLKFGILRIRENLLRLERTQHISSSRYEEMINEIIDPQLEMFRKLFLKDREIENIIVVDEYLTAVVEQKRDSALSMEAEEYWKYLEELRNTNRAVSAKKYQMTEEGILLLYISSMLMKKMLLVMGAKRMWVPGVSLADGMAYEYAEKNRFFEVSHNFEQDIIACAQNISKRYLGSKKRSDTLEKIAVTLFESMKRVHGLNKRHCLLLQIAAMLYDCGKYISLTNIGDCSYHIIMSTEIIGLSHLEREMVANVVRYNHKELVGYEAMGKETNLDKASYLVIAKLAAIIKLASGLDRSHKQKFKNVTATLQKDELIITVRSNADTSLEQGLLSERVELFEEVFSVKPIIKQKRDI